MGPHEGPLSQNHLSYTLHHRHRGGLREPQETQPATGAGGLETLVASSGWRGCSFTHHSGPGQSREGNHTCECHHHTPILLQLACQEQSRRLWTARSAEVLCLASLIPIILFHGLKISRHRDPISPLLVPLSVLASGLEKSCS